MEKTCSKCNRTKPIREFYRNPRYKDGYAGQCADCMKKYARLRWERMYKHATDRRWPKRIPNPE